MQVTIRSAIGIFFLIIQVLWASAWASNSEAAFGAAFKYTVKIRSAIEIAFAEDEEASGQGAGFIVDVEKGWILTNAHVAGRSPARLQAAFQGGKFFDLEKLYVDPHLDIAVLQAPKDWFPEDTISATLECGKIPPIGHLVGAFGHPWSLSFTGTRGIVSGTTFRFGAEWLQTDAPLNEGNSGGPLISMVTGRVVGVNTAKIDEEKTENLNLVVPMKYVCRILDLLRNGHDPSPPKLTVAFLSDEDDKEQLVVAANYVKYGRKHLQAGDIIRQIEGIPQLIRNETELVHLLRGRLNGTRLIVKRAAQEVVVPLTLSPSPKIVGRSGLYVSGMLIAKSGFRDEHEVDTGKLLMVHHVKNGSVAESQRFNKWEFIQSVDGRLFHDLEPLFNYLKDASQQGRSVRIVVKLFTELPDRFYEYRESELPIEKLQVIGSEQKSSPNFRLLGINTSYKY